MKAMLSTVVGGPETLELTETETPVPGPGQILIRTHATGVNFPDTLMIRDLYQFKPPRPFAPGGEIAGEVEALGEGVSGFAKGDRVLALDTMVINSIAILVLMGISEGTEIFFEATMIIAMLGFVSTVAYARFMLRGNIIE